MVLVRDARSEPTCCAGLTVACVRQTDGPLGGVPPPSTSSVLSPLDWLRIGSLGGAHALGLDDIIGSVEVGKEADLIVVDPSFAAPLAGQPPDDDAADLASRLIFRSHPDMVRAAFVRGRRLEGPATR